MTGGRWQDDVVERARAALPAHVMRFYEAGASDEVTAGEAESAWAGVRFRPHVLRDVREVDLATTLLGTPCAAPVGLAPTSMQRFAHPDGELAAARAAAATDTLMVVSSNAGTTFEEIAGTGVRWWLQAYLTADRELIAPTLRRAVDAGARAVVLTVDTPFPGPKRGIDDAPFGDLTGVYGVNHPELVRGVTPGSEHARDLGPDDLGRLADLTGLPVVVKGVLRADDARDCVAAGAAAVWVSNHGGRQLDRAVPTAHALPAVADAVADRAEVYVDGGVRSGLDVLAALGLGARAAFLGRLPLLALGADGPDGVSTVLTTVRGELRDALRLAGCRRLEEAPDVVVGAPDPVVEGGSIPIGSKPDPGFGSVDGVL